MVTGRRNIKHIINIAYETPLRACACIFHTTLSLTVSFYYMYIHVLYVEWEPLTLCQHPHCRIYRLSFVGIEIIERLSFGGLSF